MDHKTNINELKEKVKHFCEERDWDQYHNAKAISDLDAAICLVEEEADLLFKNKLDMLIKDEEYRRVISSNISKLASPDASIKIVDKIKNHLSYE